MAFRRRCRGDSHGAVLVEFALIAPILIMLLMGIIDFGYLLSEQIDLRSSAREGARTGVVNSVSGSTMSAQQTDLFNQIRGHADQLDNTEMGIYISVNDQNADGTYGSIGDELTVCVSYPKQSLTGAFTAVMSGTMVSKSVMRVEQPLTFLTNGTVSASSNWSSTC